MSRGSVEERFWHRVEITQGCWLWLGALKDGYGRISLGGRGEGVVRVHRLSYELHKGKIPSGYTVDHTCHNDDLACPGGSGCIHRRCVNPAHLEAVTVQVNTLRSHVALPALRARQTMCAYGHPLEGDNLYVWNGRRYCRMCRRRNHMEIKHPDYSDG